MTTSTHPMITRPGAHSAKSARQAGAPNNHQGSGENPMVGNNSPVPRSVLWDLLKAMTRVMIHVRRENMDLSDAAMALSTEVSRLQRETNRLMLDLTQWRTDHARLCSERDEIARESDLREQEVISLTVERDRLMERAVEELAGSTNGPYADYFRDKFTGGER